MIDDNLTKNAHSTSAMPYGLRGLSVVFQLALVSELPAPLTSLPSNVAA